MSDLISRQDVIELVKDSYYNLAESMADTWAMVEDVERLPSAQPERTGKWLPEYGDPSARAHYCSACKFYYTTSPEEMNYCPHCGAKMEGADG